MSKIFELFEITNDSKLLTEFRREFIETLKGPVTSKIISSNANWFYYNKGIFDVKTIMKRAFFEFSFIPVSGYDKFVSDFISYGAVNNKTDLKAIRYEGEDIFLYVPRDIVKRGRTYSTTPVIRINEDLYNIGKIISRDFSTLTTEDLSKYRDFFNVSDTPYMVVDESRIEDLYRTREISREEYKRQIENYELEDKLVKTLRK